MGRPSGQLYDASDNGTFQDAFRQDFEMAYGHAYAMLPQQHW